MGLITPRKAEVDAIESIILSDEFEDSKAMAKAIVKRALGLLRERGTWIIAMEVAGVTVLYGWEATESQAKATATKAGGSSRILPVYPVSLLDTALTDARLAAWDAQGGQPCSKCGHWEWEHGPYVGGWNGTTKLKSQPHPCRAKMVPKGDWQVKTSPGCKCKKYVYPEVPGDFTGIVEKEGSR